MRQLKLRNSQQAEVWGQLVRQFNPACCPEKSAISEHFIEASRTKL